MLALVVAAVAAMTLLPAVPAWACGKASFSPGLYTAKEKEGRAVLTVVLVMDHPETRVRAVTYQTKNGTAKSGADFVAEKGTVTFAPGGGSASFDIAILDDSSFESAERLQVHLSPGPGGACVESGPDATITVVDDDPAPKPSPIRDSESEPAPPASSGGSAPEQDHAVAAPSPSEEAPTPSQSPSAASPSPEATGVAAPPEPSGTGGGGLPGFVPIGGVALAIGSGAAAAVAVRRRLLATPPPS